MGWIRNRILGDPTAIALYRQAQWDQATHIPSIVTPDEVAWKLEMRVMELARTVPFYRRQTPSHREPTVAPGMQTQIDPAGEDAVHRQPGRLPPRVWIATVAAVTVALIRRRAQNDPAR